MATLQGFIDEVIGVVRGITGVSFVPDEPQLSPARLPISAVYAAQGRGKMSPAGSMTYLHNVQIAFVGSFDELPKTNEFILRYLESIAEAVYKKLSTGGYQNAVAIGEFTYEMGPQDWGGQSVYGLFFTFEEVKIQRNF